MRDDQRDELAEYQEQLFGRGDRPEERADPCDPVIDPSEKSGSAAERSRDDECDTERAAERVQRRTKV